MAGAVSWIEGQLRAIPQRVATARNSINSGAQTACIAVHNCVISSDAAFHALSVCLPPFCSTCWLKDWGMVTKYCGPIFSGSFFTALSNALSAMAELSRFLERPDVQKKLTSLPPAMVSGDTLYTTCTVSCDLLTGTAVSIVQITGHILSLHAEQVDAAHIEALDNGDYEEDDDVPIGPRKLPAPIPQLAAALRDSKLLASLARAITASTGPNFLYLPGQTGHTRVATENAAALSDAGVVSQLPTHMEPLRFADALPLLHKASLTLEMVGGAPASRAHQQIDEALFHPDVAALRLAMLETLWEQAGVRPEDDTEGCGNSKAGAKKPAPPAAHMSESQQQMLWAHHGNIVLASLGLWQAARAEGPEKGRLPSPPGMPTGLWLAQLAARSAQAMSRLCRGQGLGGTYDACTRRQFMGQATFNTLLCVEEPEAWSVPEAAFWAEAGAWLLAAAVEGLEVALAGPGRSSKDPDQVVGAQDLAQAVAQALGALEDAAELLGDVWPRGGGPTGRDALRHRLQGVGLDASLDRTLALASAAAKRAEAPRASPGDVAVASFLGDAEEQAQAIREGLGLRGPGKGK
ncbi:hypothetical protein HYH03_012585 [Edaphochlamys debaryana]|uniref:Uncharacterized protein n=1 Tax=Edaphochlamys debaryana TaxID=47281 RepID=A0A835XSJ9_9CHLO|nr:hypothetical protein HYH03_012585 [Edaphochlamys debaryana]|eukprot:KAG2488969.1 hypothetical protein HYH03_012585 [Edaphochlamys debaryana]